MNGSMNRCAWGIPAMLIVAAALFTQPASAVYNANITGEISQIITYADTDSIYVRLVNQPTSHPACTPSLFAFPASIPADRRKILLARLLTAYAQHEVVNIGYDSSGDCADGYIRGHRVG